jgi:hypothetical protein
VFFTPKKNGPGHIVTCIRIEDAKGSSEAVKAAGKHIIPYLMQRGYIKGFEPVGVEQKTIVNTTTVNRVEQEERTEPEEPDTSGNQ